MNMKKTFTSMVAAVLAFASISASASAALYVDIPNPDNYSEAYAYAEALYNDGYYYEAKAELEKVEAKFAGQGYYNAAKTDAWMKAVDAKIEELIYNETRAAVKKILADVKALNSLWLFQAGLDRLQDANNLKITVYEYEQLVWWEKALLKNMNAPEYQPVRSNYTAIQAVRKHMHEAWCPSHADTKAHTQASCPLLSADEAFYAIKMASVPQGFWHVYIYTKKPDGSKEDIWAFHVWADGTVHCVSPVVPEHVCPF